MGLSRARGVALLVIGTLLAVLAVTVGAGSPASAANRAAPSVSLREASGGLVKVTGRTASASPRVRFDRRSGSRWAVVKRTRAHHHRYTATLAVAAGTRATFRVTSDRRSRTFVVQMPASGGAATVTSQAAKPPTLYDACGARPRKADGTAWSCTFHDEFDGTALDRTKWVPQTAFVTGDATAGYACYMDDPKNVSVANGMLSLTVRKETSPQPCGSPTSSVTSYYTSGSVSTYHLFSQKYGRFEARIRNTASSVAGLHEAFWLWPDDRYSAINWPTTGEIDVAETYSLYNSVAIPFLHYSADAGGPQSGVNTAWNCTAYRGVWNTYTLEWTPTTLTIYVNGRTCLTNTSGDPAFQKRYIVAFTQALGNTKNAMVASTPVPATMDVDYLRVWQ
ncbi:glycoside hydrolase family 16 protein [Nocardioides pocheonensis]|uniref:Glycoside hydrolase family 16 protein n=1 Tax=Nocardioides pocheonensis TaxID=661485 RepID=A0A3N0GZ43_9ACTN|nr:glycoside hydrolase family 16 protein [Nocardioides pocheonensis]RNM17734.1 glycoside hydrolase family 16 protein [Nocardioides pocheonensis]